MYSEKISLKSLLLEYFTEPVSVLKKYITKTEAERKIELGLKNDCIEFLARRYPSIYEKYRKNNYGESSEMLMKEHLDVFNEWCNFLYEKLNSYDYHEYFDTGYPTWNYVDYRSIVKNQWLIHFSDTAQNIYYDQRFNSGVDDYTRLGLTKHLSDGMKDMEGYNFAYLLSDYLRYGKERNRFKYGKEAVLFKASGIQVWHFGDAEPQVIFWGPSAFDIVYIREDSDTGEYYVYSKNKTSPFRGEFDDCVDWVINNFNQYKRILLP
jgi:hypothetical protein